MSEPLPVRAQARAAVLMALGVATLLKTVWAVHSVGSYDAAMFFLFAKHLHAHTLASLYLLGPDFNHTPATGLLVEGIYNLTGGDYRNYAALFRGLSIVADAAVVLGLLRLGADRWPALSAHPWALPAFALSPVSICLSGFHGNVDPILTALVFYAAFAAVYAQPAWSGLFLGAACNVKIVPLLLVPIFLAYWLTRGRRALLVFAGSAAALIALGMAWPLFACREAYLRNVFGYGGYWGAWGVTYLLRLTGWEGFQVVNFAGLPPAERAVMAGLKWLTIAAVLTLAWRRRAVPPRELFRTLAAAFAVVYVFAPGGAVQYMAWFAPFLLLDSPRWWAAATAAATVFLVAFYHASAHGPFPWFVVFPRTGEEERWIPWATIAWAAFVALLLARGRAWLNPPQGAAAALPATAAAAP